jgi:hypothetical protein
MLISLRKTALICFFSCAGLVFGQSKWEWANPLPQGNHLRSVTFGNGLFVAAGSAGTIITSIDSSSWILRFQGTILLRSVTYGNGLFVVVGDSGTIITSTDGLNWIYQSSGITYGLYSVCYGNNLFVAVGFNGVITSPDGSAWTQRTSGSYLEGVTWGNNQFVVVGYGTILTSQDGINWTAQSPTNPDDLRGITYSNGLFVAAGTADAGRGSIITSTNGTTWTRRTIDSIYFRGVTYGNGLFVAVGYSYNVTLGYRSEILTSSNGSTWARQTTPAKQYLYGAIYGNGLFVAVGDAGTILTSATGSAWTNRLSGPTEDLFSVVYGNGLFVAVGRNNTILTSPDGFNWTTQSSGSSITYSTVTFGKGTFVAISYSSISTSTDGKIWTSQSPGKSFQFTGIAFGNGMFTIIGLSDSVLTSSDGIFWSCRSMGTNAHFPYGVSYCGGLFVAGGYDTIAGEYVIATSPNNSSWSKYQITSLGYIRNVAYGNGLFLATNGGGNIYTSTDSCKTWTLCSTPIMYQSFNIIFVDSCFLCVGGTGNSSSILTTQNGVSWTKGLSGSTNFLSGIAYGYSTFVAVGVYGTILFSKEDNPVSVSPIGYSGPSNRSFKVHIRHTFITAEVPALDGHGQLKAEVFNIAGKKCYATQAMHTNGTFSLPTAGLPAGMYFLSITGRSERLSAPFVLSR